MTVLIRFFAVSIRCQTRLYGVDTVPQKYPPLDGNLKPQKTAMVHISWKSRIARDYRDSLVDNRFVPWVLAGLDSLPRPTS